MIDPKQCTAHRYAIWFLERAERWYLCWNWHINSWPIISCLLTVNRWIGMWLWQVRTESMADESSISGMAPPKKERCSGSFHLQLSSWISKIESQRMVSLFAFEDWFIFETTFMPHGSYTDNEVSCLENPNKIAHHHTFLPVRHKNLLTSSFHWSRHTRCMSLLSSPPSLSSNSILCLADRRWAVFLFLEVLFGDIICIL